MTRFNDNAPALLGIETAFASSREIVLDSPTKQAAMRFETAALTPLNLSLYLAQVVGNPGIALEVVSDLDPVVTSTIYVPTSDQEVTGWVDQGGAAFTFADIDDRFNSAEYARNTAALPATGSLRMLQRGSAAYAPLVATRILAVRVGAAVMLGANSANAAQVTIEANLQLGTAAVVYPGPRRTLAKATAGQTTVPLSATLAQPMFVGDLATWYANPATGVSWTMTEVNALIAATANTGWGATVRGTVAAGGFAVSGTWIEVFTCTENRFGFYHSVTAPRAGWTRYALAAAAALLADTWYWVVMSCPNATQSAYARLPVVSSQRVNEPAVASGTGEHRLVADVALWAPGGAPLTLTTTTVNTAGDTPAVTRHAGEMFPVLLESAGPVVEPPSQAYAFVDLLSVDTSTSALNYGMQLTAGANQSYGGVQVPILWANPQTPPDRPLIVEVRSGAGAISGGGALNARATIETEQLLRTRRPGDLTASPLAAVHGTTIIAAFDDGPFAAAIGVQYHLIVRSAASVAKGWRIPRCDTHSDLIGSGPSVADIEGASQGGQTDSFFVSGAANDRYDLPVVLVAGPTAPVGNAVARLEVLGEASSQANVTDEILPSALPPRVVVSWAATSLTDVFNGYRVYRRQRGTPVRPWVLVADYTVGAGQTASVVEAQHTRFVDYEAGWGHADAIGEEGWDYAFTVRNVNGMESFIGEVTDIDNDLVGSADAWLCANAAPYLNVPLRTLATRRLDSDSNQIAYQVAGRDHAVVRTQDRVPPSRLRLTWQRLGRLTDEILRAHRMAAVSGRQMALHDCQGQLTYGVLEPPGFAAANTARADADATLTVTGIHPRPTDYNAAAEAAFDGVNDYATTPSVAALNPGTQAFTFFVCGRFTDTAGAYYLSKGNIGGAADGFAIRRNAAGSVQAWVDGAGGSGGAAIVSGGWFDGDPAVAIGTYDGATLTLYQVTQGGGFASVAAALVAGAVTNAVAFVAGADNAGGSGFTTSSIQAWGLHVGRAYTAVEAEAAGRYLLGMFGYEIPAGITVLFDLSDDRCWDGVGTVLSDLAGSLNAATLTGAPATRGRPWPKRAALRW